MSSNEERVSRGRWASQTDISQLGTAGSNPTPRSPAVNYINITRGREGGIINVQMRRQEGGIRKPQIYTELPAGTAILASGLNNSAEGSGYSSPRSSLGSGEGYDSKGSSPALPSYVDHERGGVSRSILPSQYHPSQQRARVNGPSSASGASYSSSHRLSAPAIPRPSTAVTSRDIAMSSAKIPSATRRGSGPRMCIVQNANGFQLEVGQGGPGRPPLMIQPAGVFVEQGGPSSFSLYDRSISVQDLPPPYDARMRAEAKLHLSKGGSNSNLSVVSRRSEVVRNIPITVQGSSSSQTTDANPGLVGYKPANNNVDNSRLGYKISNNNFENMGGASYKITHNNADNIGVGYKLVDNKVDNTGIGGYRLADTKVSNMGAGYKLADNKVDNVGAGYKLVDTRVDNVNMGVGYKLAESKSPPAYVSVDVDTADNRPSTRHRGTFEDITPSSSGPERRSSDVEKSVAMLIRQLENQMHLEKKQSTKIRTASQQTIATPSSSNQDSTTEERSTEGGEHRSPPPYYGPHIIGDKNLIHPVPVSSSTARVDETKAFVSKELSSSSSVDFVTGEDVRKSSRIINGHLDPEEELYGDCFACGKKVIGASQACQAMEHLFHARCFVCSDCGTDNGHTYRRSLKEKPFYNVEGKVYCEEDYLYSGFLNTAKKCDICGHVIVEAILEALGNTYHPGCFRCCMCNQCLDGVPFTIDALKRVFCVPDYHRVYAPKCATCGRVIIPIDGSDETVRVVSMNKDYHVECFQCQDCGRQLTDEPEFRNFPLNGVPHCLHCHLRKIGAI